MAGMLNSVISAGLTGAVVPRAGQLKPGLPAGDFWASLALSLLVLAALVQGGLYLRHLTRKKD